MVILISCSANDESITETEVNLQLEHYKTTSVRYGTALLVTETNTQQYFELPGIEGFDFHQGNNYRLTAKRITIKNNGTDATSSRYRLLSVQSQDTIPPNTRFTIPLAQFVNGIGYVKWVVGNAEIGYQLSNEIDLDCTSFCSELFSKLSIEDNITGEFEHGPNGTYILRALN
jgi:hypothetical protein